ncbi:hypothetical protein [Bradyrhizobium sp. STM 3557]|uniref:hypothetical protein n=1 Tax=Bradyrhizobium sp. STM 3557 TaxID=578920 RepID=UPI00388F4AFA
MNTPWIVGALLAIAFFVVFEFLAFRHPDRFNTLSHCVASVGATWPLSIWLMGLFAGILASHFFWPWCANPLGHGAG